MTFEPIKPDDLELILPVEEVPAALLVERLAVFLARRAIVDDVLEEVGERSFLARDDHSVIRLGSTALIAVGMRPCFLNRLAPSVGPAILMFGGFGAKPAVQVVASGTPPYGPYLMP